MEASIRLVHLYDLLRNVWPYKYPSACKIPIDWLDILDACLVVAVTDSNLYIMTCFILDQFVAMMHHTELLSIYKRVLHLSEIIKQNSIKFLNWGLWITQRDIFITFYIAARLVSLTLKRISLFINVQRLTGLLWTKILNITLLLIIDFYHFAVDPSMGLSWAIWPPLASKGIRTFFSDHAGTLQTQREIWDFPSPYEDPTVRAAFLL